MLGDDRSRVLSRPWRLVLTLTGSLGLLLAIYQIMGLDSLTGLMIVEPTYLYTLLGLFVAPVFIFYPIFKSTARTHVPWYDFALFLTTLGVCFYYAAQGLSMQALGWEFQAPLVPTVMAFLLWALVIEAARRTAGLSLAIVCLVFSLYPLFAGYMPKMIAGFNLSFVETARYHVMGIESIMGMPMRVGANTFLGFLIMGVALEYTGGGQFFIDFSSALLGHFRGGAAKVAVVASAFFGSLSGSVVSNVLSTGAFTIPAMKKAGFPPHMAGAVEACSSTGGVLMPPIMGAVAFLMASWLKMPYIQVAAAAVIPSILYYVSLFLQVDAFAARNGLAGIPRKELPSIGKTMKWGWQYIFVLVLLVVLMVVLQREAETPFYATAMLLVISSFRKETRLNWPRFVRFVQACGRVFVDMLPMLAAVGLIIGALSVTGMAITFAGDLTRIAGGSLPALLVMGAITSFILGMGMSVSACYLFLAIVLAPALISQGLNPVAVHLYLLYWGMISFITPPVAAGAFAGSILAKAPFMKTALTSMRLAGSIYFIPFFFVLNPTLIFQQFELPGFLLAFACSGIAVFVVSSGLQGYMAGIGELKAALFTWPGRFLLVVGGVLIGLPVDYSRIAGIAVLALSVVLFLVIRRMTVSSAR